MLECQLFNFFPAMPCRVILPNMGLKINKNKCPLFTPGKWPFLGNLTAAHQLSTERSVIMEVLSTDCTHIFKRIRMSLWVKVESSSLLHGRKAITKVRLRFRKVNKEISILSNVFIIITLQFSNISYGEIFSCFRIKLAYVQTMANSHRSRAKPCNWHQIIIENSSFQ